MAADRHAKSVDDIDQFLQANPDLGKINGAPLVPGGSAQWQGYVTGRLYNDILHTAGVIFSLTDKSRIGTIMAYLLFTDESVVTGAFPPVPKPPKGDSRLIRHWRCKIPVAMSDQITVICDRSGWNIEQTVNYAGLLFVTQNQRLYQQRLEQKAKDLNVDPERIIEAVEETFLLAAKVKRRNLAAIGDPDAESDKLD